MTVPATALPDRDPASSAQALQGAPTSGRRAGTRSRTAPPPQRPAPKGPRGPRGLSPRPGHIPGLDGIRALAILGVLVFHFTPTVLPGGFLGVDVFFVVSGFLITTLLLRELAAHGRLDLPRFWLRRARRLVPALVVVVTVSVSSARLVGGDLLVAIERQTVGALTFSTNWIEIAAGASYFHSTSPLLFVNFWSLAVEEQFYLLWPLLLVVVLALTRGTRQRLQVACGAALASAVLMAVLYQPGEDATRVYYGTDTHLFGLMLGVALAFAWAGPERAWLRTPQWRRWRGAAVLGAFVILVGLMATLSEDSAWTFRGGILLGCLATVVLVAGLLEHPGLWRTVMQLGPLTWLGQRSYGIYLWHWPVLMISATLFPFAYGTARGWVVLGSALLLTLLIAELSHRVIETPVRRHGFLACLRQLGSWAATPWQATRLPRITAGVMAGLVALAGVAIATAPEKSQTQQAIEASEAELDGPAGGAVGAPTTDDTSQQDTPEEAGEPGAAPSGGAPDSAHDDYALDDDGLLVPSGETITAIGDSLVVTSADGLKHRFPGIAFAAKSNRQWKDALPVLEDALAEGTVRDNVIVHFGTNAGVDEATLRTFLDRLGADRRVVVMNLYSSSTFVPGSNEAVAEVVADYPNTVVGDWHGAVSAEPEVLQSDRVHPDLEGMHVYARVVAEAFDQLVREGDR